MAGHGNDVLEFESEYRGKVLNSPTILLWRDAILDEEIIE